MRKNFKLALCGLGLFAVAGFGIGFDRLLMYITGMQNIRDVQPYPRTSNSIKY